MHELVHQQHAVAVVDQGKSKLLSTGQEEVRRKLIGMARIEDGPNFDRQSYGEVGGRP